MSQQQYQEQSDSDTFISTYEADDSSDYTRIYSFDNIAVIDYSVKTVANDPVL